MKQLAGVSKAFWFRKYLADREYFKTGSNCSKNVHTICGAQYIPSSRPWGILLLMPGRAVKPEI